MVDASERRTKCRYCGAVRVTPVKGHGIRNLSRALCATGRRFRIFGVSPGQNRAIVVDGRLDMAGIQQKVMGKRRDPCACDVGRMGAPKPSLDRCALSSDIHIDVSGREQHVDT